MVGVDRLGVFLGSVVIGREGRHGFRRGARWLSMVWCGVLLLDAGDDSKQWIVSSRYEAAAAMRRMKEVGSHRASQGVKATRRQWYGVQVEQDGVCPSQDSRAGDGSGDGCGRSENGDTLYIRGGGNRRRRRRRRQARSERERSPVMVRSCGGCGRYGDAVDVVDDADEQAKATRGQGRVADPWA